MSQIPLFSFGTLMDCDVLTLVTGMSTATLRVTSAKLLGFSQREVREENYPVLVDDVNGETNGSLISGLTDIALQRILFFEGDEYNLAPVQVIDTNDSLVDAQFFRHADVYEVLQQRWDFGAWQQTHKSQMLEKTRRYMCLFGTMSATEADLHWQQF